jgi:hypothetical protein
MVESSNEKSENGNKKEGTNRRDVIISKQNMYAAIVAAVITAIGTAIGGYLAAQSSAESPPAVSIVNQITVPETKAQTVSQLPESTPGDNYSVLKDISIFDLRSWQPFPDSLKNIRRVSPVNYINYLHIKKLREIDKFTAHYATSGFAIDVRSVTHKASIFKEEKPGEHEGQTRYAVEVDISNVPVNEEFLIVIEATYWNSYDNMLTESSSTYTDREINGLKELALIVFFPESKPFRSFQLKKELHGKDEEPFIRDIGALFPDQSNRFIYWSVGNITPETHYKLQWDW